MSVQSVEAGVERFREWQLAGGRFKGPQEVPTLAKWSESTDHRFNLKNLSVRKFLQWEKWNFGINLGYTDDATVATAHKVARWFFTRRGSGSGPVLYGEVVAMGYGTSPSYYKYEERKGPVVNIVNTGTPSFEWKLIGGPADAGKPVKTGDDIAIFNEHQAAGFLIYFDRKKGIPGGFTGGVTGVDLGWSTSVPIADKAFKQAVEYAKRYAAKLAAGKD
jgi:hypothetical protein